jgi:hypothetical protein
MKTEMKGLNEILNECRPHIHKTWIPHLSSNPTHEDIMEYEKCAAGIDRYLNDK